MALQEMRQLNWLRRLKSFNLKDHTFNLNEDIFNLKDNLLKFIYSPFKFLVC